MIEQKKSRGPARGTGALWTFYLLRCRDGSLYAGITTDLEHRVVQHQKGLASRYTRSRRPVTVVYQEPCAGRSHALKRERTVKDLSRAEKERLIDEPGDAAES